MFSVDQVVVWIVVGLLGGALAGALMTWDRSGYGLWRNLALGLAGAIIGGLLFRIFGIWPGLDKIAISLRDIVSAVVGSLLVLAALWLWRKFGTSQENI
ncbi:MAG: GlsB/YeaQ/YmgE family stress response membrane protein [Bradyrhizobium sp.]